MFQQLPVVIFGIVTISFGTFFSLANAKLMKFVSTPPPPLSSGQPVARLIVLCPSRMHVIIQLFRALLLLRQLLIIRLRSRLTN